MVRGPLSTLYEALARSFLAELPEEILSEVLDDAELTHVASGVTFAREGQDRQVAILISGMARAFMSSDTGRQLDVRLLHPGDSLGLVALAGQPNVVGVQALVACQLLRLDTDGLLRQGSERQAVAWAIARELSRRSDDIIREYRARAFGSVRQRLSRFLLERSTAVDDGTLAFRSSRQEIADAIGTTRRVVIRELAGLRDAGLISAGAGRLVVLDPAALHVAALGDGARRRRTVPLRIAAEALRELAASEAGAT